AIISLVIITFQIFLYLWNKRNWYWASRKFNGPLALPLIGNAWLFLCKNEEILMRIYHLTKKYNNDKPIRFWLGPILIIILMNPDHVEKILSSSKFAQKHDIYEFIKIYLGEGLISGSGPTHKPHRRIIQPMFNLNFVNESSVFVQKHVDLCMKKLEAFVNKGTFDFHEVIHKCMIDMIKEIILGSCERSQINNRLSDFDQAMIDVYNFGFSRMAKPYLQPDIIYNLTPYKRRQDELQNILKNEVKLMIEFSHKRRKELKISNEFYPIIDRLLDFVEENPGIISQEVLADHLLTLYAASEDTITVISGFVSMCLGMYPKYQEKAAKEIREIFGETPRPVTMQDINKLNYLDMCIKDTLRLFPIAPVILRKCTDDFKLENCSIPKDCAIAMPIFTIHRNRKYWENPDHFHPDHFLPEVVSKRHIYAYLPFSAGSRGCIGKTLANTALKIFICNLLQRFEIEADGKVPDLELRMDISTRPKQGYFLRLKERVWV
ncbi:unnamed protein product, partial [Ceutorhynchus assimilis]